MFMSATSTLLDLYSVKCSSCNFYSYNPLYFCLKRYVNLLASMGHAMLTLETVTAVKDGEEQRVVKVRV